MRVIAVDTRADRRDAKAGPHGGFIVIPALVTGINRGNVLVLIPVTSTGMTGRAYGDDGESIRG